VTTRVGVSNGVNDGKMTTTMSSAFDLMYRR
jgi:hypothetical protein